jgi:hypothetical protein
MKRSSVLIFSFMLTQCGGSTDKPTPPDTQVLPDTTPEDITDIIEDTADDTQPPPVLVPMEVLVLLDDEPCPDCLVVQGGHPAQWNTNPEGKADVEVDISVFGDHILLGSHPEARIVPVLVDTANPTLVTIALKRYDRSDNTDYIFKDPGDPGNSVIIEKCGHCHLSIQETWYESAHKNAASNPVVRDVYAGTAAAIAEETQCVERGGQWMELPTPGSTTPSMQCSVSVGVASTGGFGHCANCHAPGIDGPGVGTRDLQDAQGWAHDYGVHCDVCHRVETVDLSSTIPGVGGRLQIMRPSEDPKFPGLGAVAPLTFGPNHDIGNVYMGSVQRDHYRQSEFCSGCHEQFQEVLLPGISADTSRWPDGRLPIHTTFSEWQASPLNPALPCQGCHMLPLGPEVLNGADLQIMPEVQTGIVAGWIRPHGSTHSHEASGPRTSEQGRTMLNNSVSVQVVESSTLDNVFSVKLEASNTANSHAVPTGEPLRSLVLRVDLQCDGQSLPAVGGHAIPDFGGAYDQKDVGKDWTLWPGAQVGQVIRVVKRTGEYHDYTGYGPFGDGTFNATQKGMPVEEVVGMATITQVDGDTVTLDTPLAEGDRAYRVDAGGVPVEGEAVRNQAGAPGFAFARVLTGPLGERMVPHFMAVDVVSDNRLMPGSPWTSTHRFSTAGATCDDPTLLVVLTYRAYPPALARERGWEQTEMVLNTITE